MEKKDLSSKIGIGEKIKLFFSDIFTNKKKLAIVSLCAAVIITIIVLIIVNSGTYTVTFVDYDGSILEEVEVRRGTVPVFSGTTVRESDSLYDYEFYSWDKPLEKANADTTYTAIYSSYNRNLNNNSSNSSTTNKSNTITTVTRQTTTSTSSSSTSSNSNSPDSIDVISNTNNNPKDNDEEDSKSVTITYRNAETDSIGIAKVDANVTVILDGNGHAFPDGSGLKNVKTPANGGNLDLNTSAYIPAVSSSSKEMFVGFVFNGSTSAPSFKATFAKICTITFHLTDNAKNKNNVPSTQTKRVGTTIDVPSDPAANNGYRFTGWYTSTSFNEEDKWNFSKTISDSDANNGIDLYSGFAEVLYTVKFNAKGVISDPADITNLKYGDTITAPIVEAPADYTLLGWYENNPNNPWDFEKNTIKDNVTLIAKWQTLPYTINLYCNDHGIKLQEETLNVEFGDTIRNLPVLKPDPNSDFDKGYGFIGWYTDPSLEDEYKWNNNIPVSDFVKSGHSLDLYARWELIDYTIEYNLNDHGEKLTDEQKTLKVPYGSYLTNLLIPVPTNNDEQLGYEFLGWYTDKACKNQWDESLTVSEYSESNFNIRLYAKWEIKQYSIHFDQKEHGKPLTESQIDIKVKYGKTITLPKLVPDPSDPQDTDMIFDGWCTSSDCSSDSVWKSDTFVNDDTITSLDRTLVLYARWVEKDYVVHFDGGDKWTQAIQDKYTGKNKPVSAPDISTEINGYRLVYWYKQGDPYKTHWDFATTPVTEDGITLVAVWEPIKYSIILNLNDHGSLNKTTFTVDYNNPIPTIENPKLSLAEINEGYEFLGWYTSEDCKESSLWNFSTKLNKDNLSLTDYVLNLYAKWDIITYTITYNINEHGVALSDEQKTEKVYYGDKLTLPTLEPDSTKPSDNNYIFTGWYLDKACTSSKKWKEDYVANENTITSSNRTLTLFARWTKNEVKITFKGGDKYTDEIPPDFTSIGGRVTEPENISVKGYRLVGWYKEDDPTKSLWDFDNNTVSSDITLCALWEEISYTVIFNTNGHGTLSQASSKKDVDYGKPITTLPTPTTTSSEAAAGYEFLGWYISDQCREGEEWDTKKVLNESSVTTNNGVLNLYAKWQIKQYTVFFNRNKHGNEISENENNISVDYGKTVPFPSLSPNPSTDAGYIFDGWFLDEACTPSLLWGANAVVNDDTVTSSDRKLILYAHWVKPEVTVSFKGGDRYHAEIKSKSVEIGGRVTPPENITSETEGYRLTYWCIEGDPDKTPWDFDNSKVTENIVLIAQWEQIKYTVFLNLNDHGILQDSSLDVNYNNSIQSLPTPKLKQADADSGYEFLGWFTSKECRVGEQWQASYKLNNDTVKSNNYTLNLYAKWQVKEYSITFNNNDHGNPLPDTSKYKTVKYGDVLVLPTLTNNPATDDTNLVFAGWYKDKECSAENLWKSGTVVNDDTITSSDRNLVLFAKWISRDFVVKFDGGEYYKTKIEDGFASKGGTVADPNIKSETPGYRLSYWYVLGEPQSQHWDFAKSQVTKDITLVAVWEEIVYTVVYHLNDHGILSENFTYVAYNGTLGNKLAIPNLTENDLNAGYEFLGWYRTKECLDGGQITSSVKFTESLFKESTYTLDLYAKWSIKEYKITFDKNGMGLDIPKDKQTLTVKYGNKITFPELKADPSKEAENNYVVVGWFKDSKGTSSNNWDVNTIVNDDTITSSDRTLKLFAKWSKPEVTVSFKGGDKYSGIIKEQKLSIDDTVTEPVITSDTYGYRVSYWYVEGDSSKTPWDFDNSKVTKNITLIAVWEPITYTITFDTNGDKGTLSGDYDKSVEYGSKISKFPTVTVSDKKYFFDGWYTSKNCNPSEKWDNNKVLDVNSMGKNKFELKLFAKWSERVYTIVYNANGHGKIPADYVGNTIKYDETIVKLLNFDTVSESGITYKFLGWFTDKDCTAGKEWTKDTKATSDNTTINLFAKWVKVYTVTFNLNGRGNSVTEYVEEDVPVEDPFGEEGPKCDGYRFVRWYINDKDKTTFNVPSKVTKNTVVYAEWAETVKVTYLYAADQNKVVVEIIDKGNKANVPTEDMTRLGHLFDGWFVTLAENKPIDQLTSDDVTETKWDFEKKVTSDLYLTPLWHEMNPFPMYFDILVTEDAVNKSKGWKTKELITYLSDETYELKTNMQLPLSATLSMDYYTEKIATLTVAIDKGYENLSCYVVDAFDKNVKYEPELVDEKMVFKLDITDYMDPSKNINYAGASSGTSATDLGLTYELHCSVRNTSINEKDYFIFDVTNVADVAEDKRHTDTFRVLRNDGDISYFVNTSSYVTFQHMYSYPEDDPRRKTFGLMNKDGDKRIGIKYSDSEIDKYLTESFYDKLQNTTLKDAMVSRQLKEKNYKFYIPSDNSQYKNKVKDTNYVLSVVESKGSFTPGDIVIIENPDVKEVTFDRHISLLSLSDIISCFDEKEITKDELSSLIRSLEINHETRDSLSSDFWLMDSGYTNDKEYWQFYYSNKNRTFGISKHQYEVEYEKEGYKAFEPAKKAIAYVFAVNNASLKLYGDDANTFRMFPVNYSLVAHTSNDSYKKTVIKDNIQQSDSLYGGVSIDKSYIYHHIGQNDNRISELSGAFLLGDEVTISWIEAPNFEFMYWKDDYTGKVVSEDPKYTFKVTGEMNLTAHIKQKPLNEGKYITITVNDIASKYKVLKSDGDKLYLLGMYNYNAHTFLGNRSSDSFDYINDTDGNFIGASYFDSKIDKAFVDFYEDYFRYEHPNSIVKRNIKLKVYKFYKPANKDKFEEYVAIDNDKEKFTLAIVDKINDFTKGDIVIVEQKNVEDSKDVKKDRYITSLQISDIVELTSPENGKITKDTLKNLVEANSDFWLMDTAWTDDERQYTFYYDEDKHTLDITDGKNTKKNAKNFFVVDTTHLFYLYSEE